MTLQQTLLAHAKALWQLPKKVTIPVTAGILFVILYGLIFFIDKPVAFSYASKTCINQVSLFPGLTTEVNDDRFSVSHSGGAWVGGTPLITTSACFTPERAPVPGVTKVSTAPFGGWFGRKTYAVTVPSAPIASSQALSQPVPATKPLKVSLTTTDQVFVYKLAVGTKQAECKSMDKALNCHLETLDLDQGKEYDFALTRYFDGQKHASVMKERVKTLSATTITKTTIKSGETVYSKPKTINFTTDKLLKAATVTLVKQDGKQSTDVTSKTVVKDKTISLTVDKELDRSADYVATVDNVEATDGSALIDPYKLKFTMSGGPKVVGINVGRTGVGLSQTVVVTFDQALSTKQAVSKLLTFKGGSATITRQGSQAFFTLHSLPKCTDFSVTVGKGLLSKYDIASKDAWSYDARTVCHTVSTIGYSKQGRPINAYFFGNGGSTVLYTGAIHGDEISSQYLLNDWINELEAKARQIPAGRQIVVVPAINPDGVASGSRLNASSVNLNRNFATSDWKADIDDSGSGGKAIKNRGGKSPMSEPETKAIAVLSSRLRPRLVLSYHAVGSVVIGNEAGDSASLAARYASMVGYSNGTGQSGEIFDYGISGTYDDWLAQKLGVPSMIIELGSYSYRNFDHHRAAFWAMAKS